MLLSLGELADIIIITAFVGFIFSGFFRRPDVFYSRQARFFDWNDFRFADLLTAPAIILHEFGHKFVALGFGLNATFNAAYFWLLLGLVLRLANFGFVFFVPAYVSISGTARAAAFPLTALAGPAVNFALWLLASFLFKKRLLRPKYDSFLFLTARINLFLGVFNMIPLPGFDGAKVLSGILQAIF